MDKTTKLKKGYIVKLTQAEERAFLNCFMTISNVRLWGAIGYIQAPETRRGHASKEVYYRAVWDEMELVSKGE